MSFENRSKKSDKVIELLTQHFWNAQATQIRYRLTQASYGYETRFSTMALSALKKDNSATAKYIRFTPDFLIWQSKTGRPIKSMLLEYKVTTTPRFTLKDDQWNSGQIEASACDHYLSLASDGIVVAVLIYCPYHPRPLLCDYLNAKWLTNLSRVVRTGTGSGTPYCNIDLSKMRSFDEFMVQEFDVDIDFLRPILFKILNEAQQDADLQITHDEASYYRNNLTGFNWTHLNQVNQRRVAVQSSFAALIEKNIHEELWSHSS